jgi:hypothetical protein
MVCGLCKVCVLVTQHRYSCLWCVVNLVLQLQRVDWPARSDQQSFKAAAAELTCGPQSLLQTYSSCLRRHISELQGLHTAEVTAPAKTCPAHYHINDVHMISPPP